MTLAPQPTRQRYRLPSLSLDHLNVVLNDLSLRLVALETASGIAALPPVEFLTGGSVAPGIKPFPLAVTGPLGFTPIGLLVLSSQNLTDINNTGISLSAITPWWASTSSGITIRYLTGLNTNTRYRFTLGAVRG